MEDAEQLELPEQQFYGLFKIPDLVKDYEEVRSPARAAKELRVETVSTHSNSPN